MLVWKERPQSGFAAMGRIRISPKRIVQDGRRDAANRTPRVMSEIARSAQKGTSRRKRSFHDGDGISSPGSLRTAASPVRSKPTNRFL